MSISGFTFVHNAISSGYPIVESIRAVQRYVDETVVVDMQSTDSTRDVLTQLQRVQKTRPIRIVEGEWGNEAGETLRMAHSKYIECAGDTIIHFEADEVYSDSLIKDAIDHIKRGFDNLAVYRLQLELNFQRCRWYPEPVHRIFPKFSYTRKMGHTTDKHYEAIVLPPESGFLWDITNCFRDTWFNRVNKQAELRQSAPQYLMTPIHTLHKSELTEEEVRHRINGENFWLWKSTPFDIPELLTPLVGMTEYVARV